MGKSLFSNDGGTLSMENVKVAGVTAAVSFKKDAYEYKPTSPFLLLTFDCLLYLDIRVLFQHPMEGLLC